MSDRTCDPNGSAPYCEPPETELAEIYCQRHQCEKTKVLWQMCQKRGRMWRAWEEGRGPGQVKLDARPPRKVEPRGLRLLKPPGPACPFSTVMDHLIRHERWQPAIERLDRCRQAQCGLLLANKADGQMVCVGRGRPCAWLRNWAAFLCGWQDCPHWKPEVDGP